MLFRLRNLERVHLFVETFRVGAGLDGLRPCSFKLYFCRTVRVNGRRFFTILLYVIVATLVTTFRFGCRCGGYGPTGKLKDRWAILADTREQSASGGCRSSEKRPTSCWFLAEKRPASCWFLAEHSPASCWFLAKHGPATRSYSTKEAARRNRSGSTKE